MSGYAAMIQPQEGVEDRTAIALDTNIEAARAARTVHTMPLRTKNPVVFVKVKVGHLDVRVRVGDGEMPDLDPKMELPAEKLIAIGEAVAKVYAQRGWKLPKEA